MLEQIDMSHVVPGSHLQITGVSNFRHGTGTNIEYAMAEVNDGRFLWVA